MVPERFRHHRAACVDEEGKVECICGLEEAYELYIEEQIGIAESLGMFDE